MWAVVRSHVNPEVRRANQIHCSSDSPDWSTGSALALVAAVEGSHCDGEEDGGERGEDRGVAPVHAVVQGVAAEDVVVRAERTRPRAVRP